VKKAEPVVLTGSAATAIADTSASSNGGTNRPGRIKYGFDAAVAPHASAETAERIEVFMVTEKIETNNGRRLILLRPSTRTRKTRTKRGKRSGQREL
jgi:hypothetical protein